MNIKDVLHSGNFTLIDVREPMELMMDGKFDEAINIPMGQVQQRLNEIKEIKGPKIVFCRSGGRSGSVVAFLKDQNVEEVYNGGGFGMLSYMLQDVKTK